MALAVASDIHRLLRRVAAEQHTLIHTPDELAARKAYAALTDALSAQYDILSQFVNVEFTDRDPYPTSAQMFGDIAYRHRLKVYTVAELPAHHPFGAIHVSTGQTFNSIFRAVHDGLAHYPNRFTFGPVGEFQAFQAHARLLQGNTGAIHALATETLGQNAWFNFGPRSHENPKPYAPQVTGLLPWLLIVEALEHTYDSL